jgi:hypothetical protein
MNPIPEHSYTVTSVQRVTFNSYKVVGIELFPDNCEIRIELYHDDGNGYPVLVGIKYLTVPSSDAKYKAINIFNVQNSNVISDALSSL